MPRCLLVQHVLLLHSVPYLHENTAYGSQKQGKNTVGAVFSPYAQALVQVNVITHGSEYKCKIYSPQVPIAATQPHMK